MLSQGGTRDATVHFDTCRNLQPYRAVSLPHHSFIVGLCLQTAVNYCICQKVTSTRKNQSYRIFNADK